MSLCHSFFEHVMAELALDGLHVTCVRQEIYPEVVDRLAGEKRGVPSWLLKPGG
jgi:hypothetical protein